MAQKTTTDDSGSIEIERGGRVETTPSCSSPLHLSATSRELLGEGERRRTRDNPRDVGGGGSLATAAAATTTTSTAAATSASFDARWAERSRRPAAPEAAAAGSGFALDGDRDGRRRPEAALKESTGGGGGGGGRISWSSSSLLGGGAGARVGVGDEARRSTGQVNNNSSRWRTEADADLSDIKATMRRIDGGLGWLSSWSDKSWAFCYWWWWCSARGVDVFSYILLRQHVR